MDVGEARGHASQVRLVDAAEARVVVEDDVVRSNELLEHGLSLHVDDSHACNLAPDRRVDLRGEQSLLLSAQYEHDLISHHFTVEREHSVEAIGRCSSRVGIRQ